MASKTVTFRLAEYLKTGKIQNALVQCRMDFEHKGKGHPMPGFELSTDQIGASLLGLLKGIHDDRLRAEIEKEVEQVITQRPALTAVTSRFRDNLDRLARSGTQTGN